MDIKSKNKLKAAAWILLFSFGLSGLLVGLNQGENYVNSNYFKTKQFEGELNQFIDYLSMFELNAVTKEEAKQLITVSKEEIEEHRYRYGDLSSQLENIRAQYEPKIQDAKAAQNEELATIYIEERDQKINDITKNFKSDDYVIQKIIKEKEEKINGYYNELERNRSRYEQYKSTFQYYLVNTKTGEVHTNLEGDPDSIRKVDLKNNNMAFVRSYSNSNKLSTEGRWIPVDNVDNSEVVTSILNKTASTFEGSIAVPKAKTQDNSILRDYYDYQQRQMIFYLYTIGGLVSLLLSLYLYKRVNILSSISIESLKPYYERIPIDIKGMAFLFTLLFTSMSLTAFNFYYSRSIYGLIIEMIKTIFISAFFISLLLVQGKLLFETLKERSNVKDDWQKAILYKFTQMIKAAFSNRSVGMQIVLLLAIAFAFGVGAAGVIVQPAFVIIYGPAFIVLGVPILVMIFKRAGYFNRIVQHTNELVKGHFESELPIKGKTALATLASNINSLKHGVKVSQKEQAKSERLKTELITNVSHDLRTPLTSIITYTELLKTPDLEKDEMNSYIEIIDQKSKRLKVLIDDLFEASKMASGNIELSKEKVDLVQLLEQALAEHEEKISQSSLQFRVTKPDQPIYAFVDGQKMWRVFDNLIGNILNYSLENTRVYISMSLSQDGVKISFKNIAKYELGEDVDELYERFKRGDSSRHTEGSGLGLAIAKSIVDLHGGNLNIDVDGDLFKVMIII